MKTQISDFKMTTRACLTGLLFGMTTLPVMAGSIVNTKHDFSSSGWSGGEICIACHTPHNANTTVTDAPLWNHNLSEVASYALYETSPTLDATTGQPTGTSKLCLSCHDGTVAYDNTPLGTKMTGNPAVGRNADLSDDHPISFTYDAALATLDGGLFDPTAKTVTIGSGTDTKTGTIADVMLPGGQLQCASCHDVHNKFTAAIVAPATTNYLLRISKVGSALCLTCHDK